MGRRVPDNSIMDDELKYASTNECLSMITAGLEVSENDSILAVCGSGEQPLALLQNARKIVSIDCCPLQIEYILKRIARLKKGDYLGFFPSFYNLEPNGIQLREYFSENNFARLKKIKSKLEHLSFEVGDITKKDFPKGEFNKIYLSNVLTYFKTINPNVTMHKSNIKILQSFSQRLNPGNLVYLAYPKYLDFDEKKTGFVFDEDLTEAAWSAKKTKENFSFWLPIVLRKSK